MAVDKLLKQGAAPQPGCRPTDPLPRSRSAISSTLDSRILVRQIRLSERVPVLVSRLPPGTAYCFNTSFSFSLEMLKQGLAGIEQPNMTAQNFAHEPGGRAEIVAWRASCRSVAEWRAGVGRLAVFRLLNSRRGWDASHTPAQDAQRALDQVADRHGRQLPTCLVGHSLGGLTAILTAGRAEVRSVVALASWVYPSDLPSGLSQKRILIIHGSRDRVASPERSAALARPRAGRRCHLPHRRRREARDAPPPRALLCSGS